jgi:hypothetical protein
VSTDNPVFQVLSFPSTVNAGEQAEIQVRFTPATLGQQIATLTVQTQAPTTPCTVRLRGIGGAPDANEPNDSPQEARLMSTPGQGQSTSIMGNATVEDDGTVVQQLADECRVPGFVQDWFRFEVTDRGAFQVSLDFSGSDIDYDLWLFRATADFPQGIQLFASSAQDAGMDEQIISTCATEKPTV